MRKILTKCLDGYAKWSWLYLRTVCLFLVLVLGPGIGAALVLLSVNYDDNSPILVPTIVFCLVLKLFSLLLMLSPRVSEPFRPT